MITIHIFLNSKTFDLFLDLIWKTFSILNFQFQYLQIAIAIEIKIKKSRTLHIGKFGIFSQNI